MQSLGERRLQVPGSWGDWGGDAGPRVGLLGRESM